VEAASIFSKDNQSVTILINGGEISRKDIQLSLEEGRSVIALSHTGRLADEISQNFERNGLITVISANADERIVEAIRSILRIDQTHVVN
jgi:archaellum component FlaG (FlaF/FlaG flagellin family)